MHSGCAEASPIVEQGAIAHGSMATASSSGGGDKGGDTGRIDESADGGSGVLAHTRKTLRCSGLRSMAWKTVARLMAVVAICEQQ